jgi:hypothetical protein
MKWDCNTCTTTSRLQGSASTPSPNAIRVLHTCVDSTWRHVSAMFISSTAERSIGEINTRPPRYLLVPAGNLSSPYYDEQNKTLISRVSTVASTPSIWQADESNRTPSFRSMSILFASYNSIFQILSFLQLFSERSCPICIRVLSHACHIPPWLHHP